MARILVVDGDGQSRKRLVAALQLRGHLVAESEGGRAARAAMVGPELGFDLLLFDLFLNDDDGFDLIHVCRSKPNPPRLVAMSDRGNPASDYLYCALACGADLALSKAEPADDLAAAIEVLLGGDAGAIAAVKRHKKPRRMPMLWPSHLIRT